jgi:hypothetical protein
MRFFPVLAVSSAVVLSSFGCAETSGAEAEPEALAEQDFVAKGGISLAAASDADLKISLMMLDGVKAKTKSKRFIKATVTRKGRSFGAFCNLRVELEGSSRVATVGCSIGVETVSNDDDESLGFDVVLTRTAQGESITLENGSYAGDGTFLGKEAGILGHGEMGPSEKIALTAREGKDANKNVFLLARSVLDAAAPLLAEKVKSEEVDQAVAVKAVSLFVDEKMEANGSLELGRTGALSASLKKVSLLATPGDPSKGVLAPSALAAKLKGALPK